MDLPVEVAADPCGVAVAPVTTSCDVATAAVATTRIGLVGVLLASMEFSKGEGLEGALDDDKPIIADSGSLPLTSQVELVDCHHHLQTMKIGIQT